MHRHGRVLTPTRSGDSVRYGLVGVTDQTAALVWKRMRLGQNACCLKNVGQVGAHDGKKRDRNNGIQNSTIEEKVVEKAFDYLTSVSQILKERLNL